MRLKCNNNFSSFRSCLHPLSSTEPLDGIVKIPPKELLIKGCICWINVGAVSTVTIRFHSLTASKCIITLLLFIFSAMMWKVVWHDASQQLVLKSGWAGQDECWALCFPVVSVAPRKSGWLVCCLRQTSLGVLVCPRSADAVLSVFFFFYTEPPSPHPQPPSYRHLLFKLSLLNFLHIRLLHMD